MKWWSSKSLIPINDKDFNSFIHAYVLECPVCVCKKVKDGVHETGAKKHKNEYRAVSARNTTFRSRGVKGDLLRTLMAHIRKPFANMNAYALIDKAESVEDKVKAIISGTTLRDDNFELIVFKKRSDMSDVEAFFYCIRNAFAHGSFEVITTSSGKIYMLESKKNLETMARMRLKDSTLKRFIEYSKHTADQIRGLQRHKKK